MFIGLRVVFNPCLVVFPEGFCLTRTVLYSLPGFKRTDAMTSEPKNHGSKTADHQPDRGPDCGPGRGPDRGPDRGPACGLSAVRTGLLVYGQVFNT